MPGGISKHLLSLINDIFDMSRIEADKVELEERPLPEQYETRTLLAFLHKIAIPKRQYGTKKYRKLRYLA